MVKRLQAEIAELKKKMTTIASLGQVTDARALVRNRGSSSAMDAYLYGASGQVVAAVATRAQTTAHAVAPSLAPTHSGGRPRHVGLPDHIGQSRLPLSFTIADAATSSAAPPPSATSQTSSTHRDVAHSLAYNVLRLTVFAGVDFMTPDFHPASVFHLAGSMFEGKVPIPSLEVSQAVMAPPTNEDLVAMRANLAVEAISAFEANATSTLTVQSSRDQSLVS